MTINQLFHEWANPIFSEDEGAQLGDLGRALLYAIVDAYWDQYDPRDL